MARPRQHLGLVAELDQAPLAQHGDAMRDLGHYAEIVRDEEHRHAVAALQLDDQPEDLSLCRHVERSGRLVGDQQRRLECQRDRDAHALALPAGELVRIGLEQPLRIGQRHLAQQGRGASPALIFR